MAFQRGTVSNTFELTRKIHNFIADNVPGWQLWSNIDGYGNGGEYDGYDMVYRSLGSTGRNEIFVRLRVAPPEPFQRGADYHDYDNRGDTGYVIFQSYVYFPKDGDAYAGYSEIGKFGPRFMHMSGGDDYRVWHHEILQLNHRAGGGQIHITGTSESAPATDALHTITEDLNHFTQQNSGPTNSSIFVTTFFPHDTDGKANVYVSSLAGNSVQRYDMRRGGGQYNLSTISRSYTYPSPPFSDVFYLCYYEDRVTKVPYLLAIGADNDETAKLNLLTETWEAVADIPTWPTRVVTEMFTSSEDNTLNESSAICWDGGNHIYMTRGGFTAVSSSMATPDWGVYFIQEDKWRITQDPFDPSFPELPFEQVSHEILEFYSKQISGFEFNRLYAFDDGADEVWYLELDDNGLPHPGNPDWTSQGEMGNNASGTLGQPHIKFLRSGRVLMMPQRIATAAVSLWETFSNLYDNSFWFAREFPETGNIAWKVHDRAFFPQFGDGGDGAMMNLFDGYMARVRTSINNDTDYILVGDEDRIIVATKSRQAKTVVSGDTPEWNVCYAGAFESQYSNTPYGELAEGVQSGFSKEIKLTNIEGQFEPNEKYFIINTTDSMTYEDTHFMEGTKRKLVNSEKIVVTNVSGNTITASLRNSYPAGSKIARDPQPVGLWFSELEKFQVTNISPRLSDDLTGSYDPASQIYAISTENATVDYSANGATTRNTGIPLWPLVISNAESEGELNDREVRGKLKGVFSLGDFTSIEGGETISVGDNAYVILELPRYQTFIAFGPINDD